MDHGHSDGKQGCCCNATTPIPSVHQTLDEMEFERGIWSAAMNGDLLKVKSLVAKGTDPGSKDTSGYTALHYAARNGHLEICTFLLENGACANVQTLGGATPLQRAALKGHVDIVKILLHFNGNPSICDSDGKTALHKAAEGGHLDVVKILIDTDRNLCSVNDNHFRIPADCVSEKHPEIVNLLRQSC
ncbi:ankyrin repeat domain-containing protein 39-like isoform X1 [Limulus polyphemus]|uniref:Ankyrin repeat domain-containing protein 39-like isoform X1 n=1 Tax=Limulus polyphemus TaxID=6850 RepID=A0ABM1BDI8_LIMPO|nr:ankyrin repeat domain-containing protein 39-like isoform X1 [Limulus polyphemus]XP_013779797.1 ankyrin repeat domain-containing protein 39-like isoform X1 [Limulus polyphemus]XP_022247623.1 ankyrin repeat domain-containing protein 39-like isoform X1 [Limulus polyphemus]XP_022247624.1 ankyrin repeat domain-containing protein 39-like isoform X1 [Limulus polyphemus]XP_022247625.1 ankyrin repeat domain-containing protein 39-like isoform X1 [Limulus polyphemus]XP_022247626.1 ankyrin repeat domai